MNNSLENNYEDLLRYVLTYLRLGSWDNMIGFVNRLNQLGGFTPWLI